MAHLSRFVLDVLCGRFVWTFCVRISLIALSFLFSMYWLIHLLYFDLN